MPWKRLGKVFGPEEGAGWIPQTISGAHKDNGTANRAQCLLY